MQAQSQCKDFLEKLSLVEERALSLESTQAKEIQLSQRHTEEAQKRLAEVESENASLREQMQEAESRSRQDLEAIAQVRLSNLSVFWNNFRVDSLRLGNKFISR